MKNWATFYDNEQLKPDEYFIEECNMEIEIEDNMFSYVNKVLNISITFDKSIDRIIFSGFNGLKIKDLEMILAKVKELGMVSEEVTVSEEQYNKYIKKAIKGKLVGEQ